MGIKQHDLFGSSIPKLGQRLKHCQRNIRSQPPQVYVCMHMCSTCPVLYMYSQYDV